MKLKILLASLRAALRHILRPAYVVIYDVDVGGEAREEWYGYFSTPEEARRMFGDAFINDERVGNAHLAVKLHALPSRQLEF